MRKEIKSIAVVIMVITAAVFGLTACHNKCEKDGEKCEEASCCKDEKCCDKCSNKCTVEEKCCDKCKVGDEKSCCKKDSVQGMDEKKACCDKDSKTTTAKYACPMHKDITSDKPGKCSECEMEMEKTK